MKTVKTHITQLLHAMNKGIFEKNIHRIITTLRNFRRKYFLPRASGSCQRALLQGA